MPRGTSLSRFFCAFPEPAPSDSNRVHLLYQLFLSDNLLVINDVHFCWKCRGRFRAMNRPMSRLYIRRKV